MQNGYHRKLILFPPGGSGNFLANFLLVNESTLQPTFRVDWNQANKVIDMISGGVSYQDYRLSDFESDNCLNSIKQWIENKTNQCGISHYKFVSNLTGYKQIWLRKIVVTNNILGMCKNMFFKKQQLEFVNTSQLSWAQQVDFILLYLDDTYRRYVADTDRPQEYLVDFDRLCDMNYLVDLYKEANGFAPDTNKISWGQKYIDKQFSAIPYVNSLEMQEIIETINPTDVFDLAAILFTYENNWKTVDQNRSWTIDEFPNDLESGKIFLLDIAKKYHFLRG